VSEQASNKGITEILMREFPKEAIKRRPGAKGRQLDYLAGDTVIRRLIEATGNSFDVTVIDLQFVDTKINGKAGQLARATVELHIPGLGRRQGLGVQMLADGAGEDLVKGVVTDGMKKAATLFGVGLELYGEGYEAEPSVPARSSSTSSPAKPGPEASTPEQTELGKARLAQVDAMVEDYPDWDRMKASKYLRSIGMTRWSTVTDEMLDQLQAQLDQGAEADDGDRAWPSHHEGPPEEHSTPAPDDDEAAIIGRINRTGTSQDLAKLANQLIKKFRDDSHPVRVALKRRFEELKEAA
jgi:hypothetical protein